MAIEVDDTAGSIEFVDLQSERFGQNVGDGRLGSYQIPKIGICFDFNNSVRA
jgi:hypothetical protein